MNYIYRVLDYMAWFWFMEWLILVYIINRIIHGRLEIWNLSSRVHIQYLTRLLHSLVRYRCEHSKINSISPRDDVLFSISLAAIQNDWAINWKLTDSKTSWPSYVWKRCNNTKQLTPKQGTQQEAEKQGLWLKKKYIIIINNATETNKFGW